MGLVDYPDSDSDHDEGAPRAERSPNVPSSASAKRKREEDDETRSDLPPLPAAFHDLYASSTRVSNRDDPSLHHGRKRAIPHIEGNWPSHLYLEWHPSPTEFRQISNLISAVQHVRTAEEPEIETLLTSELGAQLPLHISLSRPLILLTEQRQPFLDMLASKIKTCGVRPFTISFLGLDWVPNFDRTRWFLVLRITRPGHDPLRALLETCNQVVSRFGQLPLYEGDEANATDERAKYHTKRTFTRGEHSTPSKSGTVEEIPEVNMYDLPTNCHVSIAWSLKCPSAIMRERTTSVKFIREAEPTLDQIQVTFTNIKVKIGNNVTKIPLLLQVQEGNGLLGT